jgi:DNA polymerase I-like protein with 3'-5' exonuclease and polymerase domains
VALADIEFNGMKLDDVRVVDEYVTHVTRRNELAQELDALSNGINPRSSKQVAELLYDVLKFDEPVDYKGNPYRTPGGARQVDDAVISKLKPKTDEQRKFLECKKEFASIDADLTKNLEFFYGVVKEGNGIFTARFNQTVTRTHRLSSSGNPLNFEMFDKPKSVQFQNLPRKFKKLFKARYDKWSVVELDLAQLEFRVAGYLCNDQQILTDVINREDIHMFSSEELTKAGQETDRQNAKKHTFKPLYGGKSGTSAEKAYYAAFNAKYKGVTTTQQKWINTVLLNKELRLPNGMVFYWPDVKQENGWVNYTANICNYPVQHFATAEIVPILLYEIWSKCKSKKMETFLTNTIHDSVIAEVPPYELDQYYDIIKEAVEYVYTFLKDMYDIEFFIPLGYEVKTGINLGEGKEFKVETATPFEFIPDTYNEDY